MIVGLLILIVVVPIGAILPTWLRDRRMGEDADHDWDPRTTSRVAGTRIAVGNNWTTRDELTGAGNDEKPFQQLSITCGREDRIRCTSRPPARTVSKFATAANAASERWNRSSPLRQLRDREAETLSLDHDTLRRIVPPNLRVP